MLDGIFASLYTTSVTAPAFLAVCLLSVGLGYGIALTYRKISGEGGTMFSALTVLPFLVQLVILLVNGNLGAGVAVAGAFSLVRFRSAPGSARDITVIFLSMTVGLCCGMGYWAPAVLAALVTCGLLLLQKKPQTDPCERELRVTIPENLDYNDLFSDLFAGYTASCKLLRVKTVNMGSLYSLHYLVRLKDPAGEKELLDAMRCRNGNLEISCGLPAEYKQGEIL
jgi:hypothetical protein